ncbi:uncharacterized protein LOC104905113 isoform X2 [Beta vulgaris subsp. vulgaris]|uniref:uncharacterized protein LOC104905113 isoform X2 n=1 Tax=Beta vulgaris subsp. vulgaris TaxID=3555 RepID=UPI000900615A|nr:uncharacterized protein LOC104905113 isoform X2 [Beta vulgaris subsp. vulgaris]
MGTSKKKKPAQPSSDHKKWELIFNALKQMLRKQAVQLDSLLEERKFLQERIQIQYERWNSDVRLLEDVLFQTQRQLSLSELGKLVEIAKSDLLVGSKNRSALMKKLKLDAQSELDDFKAWFDILSHRCPDKEVKDMSPERLYESLKAKGGSHSISKEAAKHHSKFEKEISMLKHEYEKLSMKHKSDVSGLQDENTFVWNQYKEMEGKYISELQTKNDEINREKEKIMNLLTSMEQLQSASIEKDDTVAILIANISTLEAEGNKKDGEISRLSKELELLKSKISDGSTELSSSGLKGKRTRGKRGAALEKEATSAQLQVMVSTLIAEISELEAEVDKKNGEISMLSKETKLLRSNSSAGTPVLKPCIIEPSASRRRDNGRSGGTAAVEDEVSFAQLEATIATLRVKVSELQAERNQKDGEISALSKELELSRSKSAADTPALRRCTSRPPTSRSRGRENRRDKESAVLKEEASSLALASMQGGRRSKRKQDIINIEETPRLFTSQFKIPKLRSQSPCGR